MRKLAICLLLAMALAATAFAGFSDVEGHWAKAAVETMAEKNVINGYGDGTFRPEGTLTRAEFLTMCVRLAGLPTPQSVADPWWRPYAGAADAAGWELPFEATADGMGKPINRQEMAAVLKWAANQVAGGPQNASTPVLHGKMEDLKDYELLLEDTDVFLSVDQCVRMGFLGGYPDGEFKPLRTLTRAEAATVLCRLDSAREIWEQGGRAVVFTDDLKIWQTYGEKNTTIHSAKDGKTVSEITVADGDPDNWALGFHVVNANGKYFWGEPGFYEYDDSGRVTQLTDLPAIDYGYDVTDGSIVFLTHDKSARVGQRGGGIYSHAADSVARLHADGTVEMLLTKDDPIALVEAEQRGELTKVERAHGGEVWVQMSYVMGMGDYYLYRVVVRDHTGTVVPTSLYGEGYSY